MSIEIIKGNNEAKRLIKNELKKKKDSGTYLFYGRKGADLFEFALAFAKGICCQEEEFDYCNTCRICKNIDKKVYSDLHILSANNESIKIDQIRAVIKDASESSYEGGKKVFIIEGINKLRKEAANALLKIIEEPPLNTYFILLSNSLNILPTIKSRTIGIEIRCLNHEELGVSREVYDFFAGNVRDIKDFREKNMELPQKISYGNIAQIVEEYLEIGEFEKRVEVLAAIEDFAKEKKYIDKIDKIRVGEDLDRVIGKNREFLVEILYLFIIKCKLNKNLEKLLMVKESINYNVNTNMSLVTFMLNI